MDQARKLKLLAQCDFSLWRERKRTGHTHYQDAIGFGSALVALYGGLSNVATGLRPESSMEFVGIAYETMKSYYDRIPWKEMDRSDEDFRFLFEFREGLGRLGEKLQALGTIFENGGISPQSPELVSAIGEAKGLIGKNYRRDVLRKYGIDLSEPESNQ